MNLNSELSLVKRIEGVLINNLSAISWLVTLTFEDTKFIDAKLSIKL
jgi:hypothetical protein